MTAGCAAYEPRPARPDAIRNTPIGCRSFAHRSDCRLQRLSDRLSVFDREIESLTQERDSGAAAAESLEAGLLEVDAQVGEINEAVRLGEAQLAANRERIAAQESTIEHERARGRDLDQEIGRYRRQVVALSARARRFAAAVAGNDRGGQGGPAAAPADRPAVGRRRTGADRSNGPARSGSRRERTASHGTVGSDAGCRNLGQ